MTLLTDNDIHVIKLGNAMCTLECEMLGNTPEECAELVRRFNDKWGLKAKPVKS